MNAIQALSQLSYSPVTKNSLRVLERDVKIFLIVFLLDLRRRLWHAGAAWSIFCLKRWAFQAIRPVASRKKCVFSVYFGRASRFTLFKSKAL